MKQLPRVVGHRPRAVLQEGRAGAESPGAGDSGECGVVCREHVHVGVADIDGRNGTGDRLLRRQRKFRGGDERQDIADNLRVRFPRTTFAFAEHDIEDMGEIVVDDVGGGGLILVGGDSQTPAAALEGCEELGNALVRAGLHLVVRVVERHEGFAQTQHLRLGARFGRQSPLDETVYAVPHKTGIVFGRMQRIAEGGQSMVACRTEVGNGIE